MEALFSICVGDSALLYLTCTLPPIKPVIGDYSKKDNVTLERACKQEKNVTVLCCFKYSYVSTEMSTVDEKAVRYTI